MKQQGNRDIIKISRELARPQLAAVSPVDRRVSLENELRVTEENIRRDGDEIKALIAQLESDRFDEIGPDGNPQNTSVARERTKRRLEELQRRRALDEADADALGAHMDEID